MKELKPSGRVCPREFFSVSDEVSYLEPVQMEALRQAFVDWKQGAKRADSVLSRERMWLIFSLLCHTGARLGEILSLDDRTAFDPECKAVRLGPDDRQREVPLPEELYEEVQAMLESPMGCSLRGRFFQVDPGYFRRICYARGKECGLTKELVRPKSLRNTRAVEMLRGGVPITIVRDVLGQSSLDLTANFQQFSQGDMQTIVRTAHESMRKRTSARNSFICHVTKVKHDGVMAQVEMETRAGDRLSSVITEDSLVTLKLQEGSPVIATVKAPLVNVVAGTNTPPGSARNRFKTTVIRVTETPVVAEVLGRLPDGSDLCALIAADSAKGLALQAGDEVEFWFKALSVVLNTVNL